MTKPFILTAPERLRMRKQVKDILRHGRQNAITGKDIARMLDLGDDRKVRLVIRDLIAEGIPVASSVSEPMGFYIVTNEHEAADYIRVMESRIKDDTARLNDFKEACSDLAVPAQQEMVFATGETA